MYKLLLATLAGLAAASGPHDFVNIGPVEATDFENGGRCIEFTAAMPGLPGGVYGNEIGSGEASNCKISWSGSDPPPTCWSKCDGKYADYRVRVTPGSYKDASDFTIDFSNRYNYKGEGQHYGVVQIHDGSNTTYTCRSGKYNNDKICSLVFIQETMRNYGSGIVPTTPEC